MAGAAGGRPTQPHTLLQCRPFAGGPRPRAGLLQSQAPITPAPMAAAAADGSGAPPPTATLAFPDRGAPLGVLLAAQLAGLALDARVDPKLAKSGPPVLTAEGGCADGRRWAAAAAG